MIKIKIVFFWGLMGVCGLFIQGCREVESEGMLARFYLEESGRLPLQWSQPVELPVSGTQLHVASKPFLYEAHISNVELVQVELGQCLLFQFTPKGSGELYQVSMANIGKRILLTLNGQPVGARRIEQPIGDGNLLIFLEIPDDQLPEVVEGVREAIELVEGLKDKD